MTKKLLTIQDISCFGQCSLTVALPVISACGIETVVLPSAVLSTHTGGFKNYTFRDLTDDIPAIRESWQKEKLEFNAFYTGYVCPNQIKPILDIFASCAAKNALRIVDPVMGDRGQLYPGFKPDFPDQMRELCAGADYVLPNITEAALMLKKEVIMENHSERYIREIISGLHNIGAKNVILTGVTFSPDKLGVAVSDGKDVTFYFNDKINRCSHGTGDVFASVFAGAIMRGFDAVNAAALAADIVCAAIKVTPDEHWYGVCFEKVLPELISRLEKK